MKCRTCRKELPDKRYAVKTGGRVREYCNDNCRNTMKYWHAFQRELEKSELTPEAKKEWASRLFQMRNEL